MTRKSRRFPLEPLATFLALHHEVRPHHDHEGRLPEDYLSKAIIAEALGVTRRTTHRYFAGDGMIREEQADRAAEVLGRHPSEIWPDWFDDGEYADSA